MAIRPIYEVWKIDENNNEIQEFPFLKVNYKNKMMKIPTFYFTIPRNAETELSAPAKGDKIKITRNYNDAFAGFIEHVEVRETTLYFKGRGVSMEWQDYIRSSRLSYSNDQTRSVINDMAYDIGWNLDGVEQIGFNKFKIDFQNYQDRLKELAVRNNAEFRFNDFDRLIQFGSEVGDDLHLDVKFMRGYNMNDLSVKKDEQETYDYVIALGAGDGVNQLVATAGSGNKRKVFKNKEIEDQGDLQNFADKKLAEGDQPAIVRYKCKIDNSIFNFDIGDTVWVEDDKNMISQKMRIMEYSLTFDETEQIEVSLANRNETLVDFFKNMEKGIDTLSNVHHSSAVQVGKMVITDENNIPNSLEVEDSTFVNKSSGKTIGDIEADVEANKIVKQPLAPSNPSDGQLWLDTDSTPNVVYRWDEGSSSWKESSAVSASQIGAEKAIYKQGHAPADTEALWLDTDPTPNVLKRYDDGQANWVKVTPTQASEVGAYNTSEIDNMLSDFVDATVYSNKIADLEDQIDGNITSHFGSGVPTLSNSPAVNWDTTAKKDAHLGDLYYDNDTGRGYRFQNNGSYFWKELKDSDIQKALSDASDAQDTADSKRRVFVVQPTVPYDKGDLWADDSSGSEKVYRATVSKSDSGSFSQSDWKLISDITNENTANDTDNVNGESSSSVQGKAQDGKDAKDKIDSDVGSETIENTTDSQSKANDARDEAIQHTDFTTGNLVNNVMKSGSTYRWHVKSSYTDDSTLSVADVTFDTESVKGFELNATTDSMVLSDRIKVDMSKAYELSLWMKADAGDPSAKEYFGIYAFNSSGSKVGVKEVSISDGSVNDSDNSNPYFWDGQTSTNWVRRTAYLLPFGFNSADVVNMGINVEDAFIMNGDIDEIEFRFLNWSNNGTARSIYVTNTKMIEVSGGIKDIIDKSKEDAENFTTGYAEKKVTKGTAFPSAPDVGQLFIDESIQPNVWYKYDGSEWVNLTPQYADEIKYTDGQDVETLQPAQGGADVTGQNTANDTQKVNGTASSTVESNASAGKGASDDLTNNANFDRANHVIVYDDGTNVDSLKPASAGADVTGDNTANDTSNVNGESASSVKSKAQKGSDAKDKITSDVGSNTIENTTDAQSKANTAENNAKFDGGWGIAYNVKDGDGAFLQHPDGSALDDAYTYEVTARTKGTSTESTAIATFQSKGDGNGWDLIHIYRMGTSSNHPRFYLSNGKPAISTWHTSYYYVEVSHSRKRGRKSASKAVEDNAKSYTEGWSEQNADVTGNNTANDVQTGAGKAVVESGADKTSNNTANDVQTGAGKAVVESGADKTSNNTSADTSKVNGTSASTVKNNASAGKSASDDLDSNVNIDRAGNRVKYSDGNDVDDLQPSESGATSGADWETNVSNKPKTFRVVTVGNSSTTHPTGAGIYNESGSKIDAGSRSYNLSVLDRTTQTWDSHTTYDVYSSASEAGNLATALNNLGSDKIIVLFTYDEPKKNRLNNSLPQAIKRAGGSRTIFESSNFKHRGAYILIGIGGIGEGNGLELYAGDVDSDSDAWVETKITVEKGNIQLGTTKSKMDADDLQGKVDGATQIKDYSITTSLIDTQGLDASVVLANYVDADNVEVKSSNSDTTINSNGVTVKGGSFYLKDDNTNDTYSIVPKTNLIADHSFEMQEGFGTVDGNGYQDIVDNGNDELRNWNLIGSPKLLSAIEAGIYEGGVDTPFGGQSVIVNHDHYVRQRVNVRANEQYSISFHAHYQNITATQGTPQLVVQFLGDGSVVQTDYYSFSKPDNTWGKYDRHIVEGIYAPNDMSNYADAHMRLYFRTEGSNYVGIDGVQVVQSPTATSYDPEDQIWKLRRGIDKYPLIDAVEGTDIGGINTLGANTISGNVVQGGAFRGSDVDLDGVLRMTDLTNGYRTVLQRWGNGEFGYPLLLQGGDTTIIAGGEGGNKLKDNVSGEHLYLGADGDVIVKTDLTNKSASSAPHFKFDNTGWFDIPKGMNITVGSGNVAQLATTGDRILCTDDFSIAENKGFKSDHNNGYIMKDHGNGNVTLSATGNRLYIGYYATNELRLTYDTGSGKFIMFNDDGTGSEGGEPTMKPNDHQFGYIGTSGRAFYQMHAYQFVNSSSEEIKTDISETDTKEMLDLVNSMRVKRYKGKNEAKRKGEKVEKNGKEKDFDTFGVIIEEVEELPNATKILDDEQKGVNVYSYASAIGGAVQELSKENKELREELEELKGEMRKWNNKGKSQ
ncbi:interleukin-like EMT inducer domain-containing protein (plasmid) [Halobacillus litoralis]|uniref:phage tail protein n=1 Tax=Halobacillus litoralis TaxID=45668 RepID=UPI001CFD5634|nr:phage tail protein [Halobacillus litoralis]WLR49597.1 interleukin-like EMT inducer domain-containing protein [Halobacillus litoralis]